MKRALLCGASAAAVTVVAGLWGSAAVAQTTTAAQPPANMGADVTVVATKRTESVEKVPVAVTAFSNQQRALVGIKTVNDMAQYTPGLSYFNGDDRAFIRGIGRQTDLLSVSPGVAVYKDGVYAGGNGSIALQQDTLFVDRIEVDRGPQSTLYGRNSDGGAINYIFRRPTSTWQEEVRGGIANYDKYFAEGLVSGPLNDHVRILFGGNYTQQNGGYWNDLIGHREGGDVSQGGNGTSHFVIGQISATWDKLDWWAKASTGDYVASWYQGPVIGPVNDTEFPAQIASFAPSSFYGLCAVPGNTGLGCGPVGAVASPTTPFALSPDTVVPGSAVFAGHTASTVNPSNANNRDFIGGVPNTTSVRDDLALATTLTYHAPGADVKYTGGYESFYYSGLFTNQSGSTSGLVSYQLAAPAVASPLCTAVLFPNTAGLCTQPLTVSAAPTYTTFVENEQFFSHELTVSSTYQGPLQYIAGVYWFHDHYDQPIDLGVGNQPQFLHPFFAGVPLTAAPASSVAAPIQTDRAATANDYAIYGQLDWKVTDTLKLTGGLRYTWDTTSGFISERFETFADSFAPLSIFGPGTLGANTPAIDVTAGFANAAGACTTPGKGAGPCVTHANGFISQSLNANWSALTGTAGVEWTPDSHTLAYAKYSRGYKTGAFQTPSIITTPETAPEYVDAYEAGVKLTHPTWQINGDVFYYNYQNDQQPLTVQVPGPTAGSFVNTGLLFAIPRVESYGVELEGIWHPVQPLVISAQYSYLSAKIASTDGKCLLDTVDPLATQPGANPSNCTQTSATAILQNVVGQSLPQAPANKFSINGICTFEFEPGSLALSAAVTWRDVSYGTIFNRQYDQIPSNYGSVNLTWRRGPDTKNRYSIVAFAHNLFDQTLVGQRDWRAVQLGGPDLDQRPRNHQQGLHLRSLRPPTASSSSTAGASARRKRRTRLGPGERSSGPFPLRFGD